MTEKPIPAFYGCYLLRSSVRHASLYIGSTPNPRRRLAQHNGLSKGGAKRTARENLRPWEMVIVVHGFPSRVAALQFEWAWQKTHASRHVDPEEANAAHRKTSRANQPDTEASGVGEKDVDANADKGKKRKARPTRRSLLRTLADLHRLLRSAYFTGWPLTLRFFAPDVQQVWTSLCDREAVILPGNIQVVLEKEDGVQSSEDGAGNAAQIRRMPVDYSDMQDYVGKSAFLLDGTEEAEEGDLRCRLCKARVIPNDDLVAVCPQMDCHCITHVVCLAAEFLKTSNNPDQLVPPMQGMCPACQSTVSWTLMMKELSLRTRGRDEVQNILKRKKRMQSSPPPVVPSAVVDSDSWDETHDLVSDSSTGERSTAPLNVAAKPAEIVIEDSEWDDVDVLE
ncbi:hypothetical protein ASPZODRAFT_150726 [Penicilliopsis zonata CBS 506.65]|uniref:GIY-YIG domain-containing protein n=1 Tax=Penicilliopsis zonata CBS 506.65 TaxID=1073090 RepID=A0A1L9SML4_9EURO|nr:hypothetical protein ASPZODRAFT_150726 [Penicilliopsis zonata CBS 506.65]OJJ48512.1 hypothetical protein ASPZODRAFT_150726 [Penicilliopsis zonata CBS 506.65]